MLGLGEVRQVVRDEIHCPTRRLGVGGQVAGRGLEATVAKQALDGPDVSAGPQPLGSGAMPHRMDGQAPMLEAGPPDHPRNIRWTEVAPSRLPASFSSSGPVA